MAVESTGNARYFKNRVEALGIAVVAVNTLKFKVVNESVKKTDRHDASTLAEFLEKDMLPTARLCSQQSEELRRLVKARSSLVRTVEAVMEELVKDDRVVELIRTIPGAGLITATTIRAYVDDIQRFESPKQLAAYAGLTPWVQNSADRERHGRITKRGPNELRTALVQVVLGLVRNKRRTGTYRIMLEYSEIKPRKGSGRTIIATARKLSEIIWQMLHEEQPFDEAWMKISELRYKAMEMRAAALDVA